jgi:nucleotide-binding universal stress UspA family protein
VTKTPSMRPVLLFYDGSDQADRAIRCAGTLLRGKHAVVLHAPQTPFKDDVTESARRVVRDAGFDPVALVKARHGCMPGVVREQAHHHDVSVIVVAAHGGSVLHRADRPVLVVPPAAPPSPEIRDGLARLDRQEAEAPDQRASEGAQAAARAGLVARPVGIPGVDASSDEEEEPWRRLLRAAADEEAACIVVGHRPSAKGLASTAHSLVREADRPVLVVPGVP